MTNLKEALEQERRDLVKAYNNNLVSNNEYQSLYYAISQKIKRA